MKNLSADGLRGIAALCVVTHHFFAAFFPMLLHNLFPGTFTQNPNPSLVFEILESPIVSMFYNGHLGVLIFFVLSGYVLTLPYYSGNSDFKLILEKRLWGRYFRLSIPIIFAVFAAYLFYALGLYSNAAAADISGSLIWLKGFFSAEITFLNAAKEAFYASLILGQTTLVSQLWTIKIEFLGSLYLLIFYITKPKSNTIFPLLLIFFIICFVHKHHSIYYIAIFMGSLLYKLKDFTKYRNYIFMVGLYFGAYKYQHIAYSFLPDFNTFGTELWEKKVVYHAIAAFLITLAVIQGYGKNILESRIFQFFGKISFSIYLMHMTILCSLSTSFYLYLPQGKFYILLNFILYIAACIGVSVIFEKYIDRYAIRISHKISPNFFAKTPNNSKR